MIDQVQAYIREQGLMRAGDRVGVAVSGGADSVALLRLLLELRADLGIVLSVVHFHHGIRGEEADADQKFVEGLAKEHGLECRVGRGDVPAYAKEHHLSLEAAGRKLRYDFFRERLSGGGLDRIATAHTLDDQAETVLMRLLRGAGTRGLAGIYPARKTGGEAAIVRPLLAVTRAELRSYLAGLGQGWREDATNLDRSLLRNRVRLELLPALEAGVNPGVRRVLAETAELARAEEEYWAAEVERARPLVATAAGLDVRRLAEQPLALRRRLVRAAAEASGLRLGFEHVEEVLRLIASRSASKACELPGGWRAALRSGGMRFEKKAQARIGNEDYVHPLPLPGEVAVTELGTVIRASLAAGGEGTGYNPRDVWRATGLVVRNWRAGDRFRPAHTKSAKKLKELLQPLHLDPALRALWPVVAAGDTILWVRGLPPAAEPAGVLIEEIAAGARTKP